MFGSASSFNQPLDNFDTSKVTDMRVRTERARVLPLSAADGLLISPRHLPPPCTHKADGSRAMAVGEGGRGEREGRQEE